MPRRILSGCKAQGCPNRSVEGGGGYCEIHQGLYQKEKSERGAKYNKYNRGYDSNKRYGAGWKKIRDIYIKEHPFCEECQSKGINTLAVLVHHRVPLSQGGNNSYENLESVCAKCHEEIHRRLGDR